MDKVIINPVTGERVTFLSEGADTNGEITKIQVELTPYAKGVPKHYHTGFTENFEVLEGELVVTRGSEKRTLRSGESALVKKM